MVSFVRSASQVTGRWVLLFILSVAMTGLMQGLNLKPAFAANGGYPWSGATYVDANYDWGYSTCPSNDTGCMSLYGYLSGVKMGEADPWVYYLRNCTSYAAWKINNEFGVNNISGWGNAVTWNTGAANSGYTVHNPSGYTPQVGDLAQWGSEVGGGYGHVAYVYAVNNGVASLDEYNSGYPLDANGHPQWGLFYNGRTTAASSAGTPDHYIHIGSLAGSTGSSDAVIAPNYSGDIADVNQANGLEEVFYVGGDNAIWYRYQNANGSWSAQETMTGTGAKAISAVQMPDGRVEIVYVGGDNAVWYRYQTAPNTDSWSAQHSLGGGASAITSVREPDGRIGVFYVGGTGGTNAIWYRWQNTDGSWSSQEEMTGTGAQAISATLTSDGRIDLWYVGGDNAVWHRLQSTVNTDTWSAQYSLGGGVG